MLVPKPEPETLVRKLNVIASLLSLQADLLGGLEIFSSETIEGLLASVPACIVAGAPSYGFHKNCLSDRVGPRGL